ncbi:FAD-dependent oxidoreductase [Candidatus Woesearchaeota archaeon]|jgi:protoporphyrinogen oxidase|nr:FAD-dependent oxidoreductase [Candidatus Woesearchaeota archaeon]
MKKQTIVILGSGVTGLVSAYYLSKEYSVILVEKNGFIGGAAAGFNYKEFILDFGPHKLYTELPGILNEMQKVTPLLKIKKKNSIYLNSNYFDFPLKLQQILLKMPKKAINAGFDIILKNINKLPDDSYENFLINRFGKTLYNLSFKDYAEKVWSTDPKDLSAELARRRVAISGISELIKSILFNKNKKISAEYFYYPPKGIRQLLDALSDKIKENGGSVFLNSEVSEISLEDNKVKSLNLNKKEIKTDYLLSTIPLDDFAKLIGLDNESREIEADLKYQKLNIIYFILNKQRVLKDCWVFFPEKRFIFQRISEQKAFSNQLGPENKTVLMVETTKEVNENLINEIIAQLESIKVFDKKDIDESFVKSYNKSYPIYKKEFKRPLNKIIKKIESIKNLYSLGRAGLFNYNNMDQCWDMALKVSEQIKENKTLEDWKKTKEYFESYRIVD